MAMADDPETKIEIEDEKEDLRDALHEINNRVEKGVARLRPDRGIRKHPVTSAAIAGALGFALGADSGEVALIGLLFLGGAIVLTREPKVGNSDESERQ
jgi:hypothetical protein